MSFIVAPVYFDGTTQHNPAVNLNVATHCDGVNGPELKDFKEVLIEWDGDSWEEVTTIAPGATKVALRIDNPCDGSHEYVDVPFNDFRILGICCRNCPLAADVNTFALPDVIVGTPYNIFFPILGNGPWSMTILTKPSWMTITLDPDSGLVIFTGTPTGGDLDDEAEINILVNNCGKEALINLDTTISVYEDLLFTARTAPNVFYRDIVRNDGKFTAIGEDKISYSADGITWSAGSSSASPAGVNKVIAAKPGLWVMIRETTSGLRRSFTSVDGQTFTSAGNLPSGFDGVSSLCYDTTNNQFVAVGDAGTVRCATSPDGVTWTARPLLANIVAWTKVFEAAGIIVAVGHNACQTSTDGGINWTAQVVPPGTYTGVTHNGVNFVATTDNSALILSADGVTWNSITKDDSSGNVFGIFFANSNFICFSDVVFNYLFTKNSPHWHQETGMIAKGMAFGAGLFVAAGGNGIFTSPGV